MWTNTVNGKKYIGKSQRPEDHSYMGSGYYFKKAVQKYGKEQFTRTILQRCDDKKELMEAEKYWLDFFDASNNKDFYNISPNSGGGHHGRDMSGSNNPMFGKKHPNHKPHYGKENGMYGVSRSGSTNPNSKQVMIIDPRGQTYYGDCLKEVCTKIFGDDSNYTKMRHFVKRSSMGLKAGKNSIFYGWQGEYLDGCSNKKSNS